MNSAIPFIWVQILAVTCYSLLIIALLSAEKNKVIRSFIYLLFCLVLWTGGSMLMRLQVFPSYAFWYEISLMALFTAPFLAYNFLYEFVGAKGRLIWSIAFVSTVVMLVLSHLQLILKTPNLIQLSDGQYVFVYEMTWTLIFPSVISILILACSAYTVIIGIKKLEVPFSSLRPIFIGFPIILLGNIVSVIPGNLFPFDTLAGVIYAILIFYALYRNRLFRMTLLVSRGVVLAEAMILGSILSAYQISTLETFIIKLFPIVEKNITLIIAIIFAVFIMTTYRVINIFLNSLFLKVEQLQNQRLKDFSIGVSHSLNLKDILLLLITFIMDSINTQKIFVCLKDPHNTCYKVVQTATPLDSKNFSISMDNPCITWLKNNKRCLILKEFKRSSIYKSLHDSEKRLFADLNVSCIVPLIRGDELTGIILLSGKQKSDNYSYDDIVLLESAQAIASVAIKNASLYEQAKHDACTDPLTGSLNRKTFMEILENEVVKCKDSSLSLLIINLDDFKLFNQLYGSLKGDMALKNIADIIKNSISEKATAGRYGNKEFAICMPNTDIMQTVSLAENIQLQVSKIDDNIEGICLKALTLSGGICAIPYGATTFKELLENADMAVYNAKRSGKNKICVYSTGTATIKDGVTTSQGSTGDYSDYAATVYALTAAIDAKDHYTFSHSQNVELYSTELAKAAGINVEHVKIIREAALLHDIGKIAIPEILLAKTGKLTRDEYAILKTHVEHSISIIRHLPSLDYVIPCVVAHHERWDGRGYPRGISKEDIPIGARCLAIADSFDAMVSERAYKPAFTTEFACQEIIDQAGKQFDPKLAELFVELIKGNVITVKH
ncbi:MAG: diguanylate cyclase [Peptostreptococcaceae bacterium]|nr:diguanylate cyclase [Peptostreptococcaceae bacterium]